MSDEKTREKILEAIGETRERIDLYRELTRPVAPDVAIGRLSRMDAINNKSVNEEALRKAENRLQNLERVLKAFGTDNFGRCLKCRQKIPEGRLLFRPESLYCVNCAR